jgi:hypothetical protein
VAGLDPQLLLEIQRSLMANNELVKDVLSAWERHPGPDVQLVIQADRAPAGEHRGRYNAPSADDVGAVVVGLPSQPRDIVLQQRNGRKRRVPATNPKYDALQYPIFFPKGENTYHFLLRQVNPVTKEPTNKKVFHFVYLKSYFGLQLS